MDFLKKLTNVIFHSPDYFQRVYGPRKELKFENIEILTEFYFTLPRIVRNNKISALVRARDEGSKIGTCLKSIYSVFDEIVVVNNHSTDDTEEIVKSFIVANDKEDKIRIYNYPFDLSRIGQENEDTDPNSIHSFVYYSNWCLSKCTMGHIFKWDSDMILPQGSIPDLYSVHGKLNSYWPSYYIVPLQTIYIRGDYDVYEAIGEINMEYMIFPNRSDVCFEKNGFFELLTPKCLLKFCETSGILIYEVKDVREDEFSHWTSLDFPTVRKKREWENFNKVKDDKIDDGFKKFTNEELDQIYFLG